MPAGSRTFASRVALALALLAGAAHADWREAYSRGLAALKDGDNAGARKQLQQALAEQPEPSVRTRLYGQRWEPYLPQYYLGVVAFRDGDCAAALGQWNSSASRQVVAQLPEIRDAQQRDAASCEQKLAAATPAPKPPVASAATAAPAAPAKAGTAAVPKPPPVPTPAKPEPGTSRTTVASVERPPRVEAQKPPPEKTAEPARTPPTSLVAAFDEFLAGRYADVGRIDPKSYADARARFHAYVVRAAARYTLAEISGDKDLLEGARADARAARALDAKATPDGALFSPRFRAFYREGS